MKIKIPSMRLDDKSAIVTGASRGLGRVISLGLANAGADLLLASIDPEGNDRVAGEIHALGRKAIGIRVDITRSNEVKGMAQKVQEIYGKVDILVNNAGISPIYKRMEDIKEETWEDILRTNLKGAFLCCQLIGELMRRQGFGRIINIASVAGMSGSPRLTAYAASKAGLINLTRTLAIEWAPHNVLVNAIVPGYFETGLGLPIFSNERLRKEVISHIPMGRFGKEEEICGAVVFLASEAASYVTGALLPVDGGWCA